MKSRILVLCLSMFSLSLVTNAQGNFQRRSIEERVKEVMTKITPALALTAEQQPKADSAFTQYYRSMQALREGMQPGSRPDRSQFEKLTIERDEKLKAVLTPDQYKKFKDEVEETLRPQRGNRQ